MSTAATAAASTTASTTAAVTAAATTGRPLLTRVRRRVEHVDTDASGVVHFARYPSLLETAALENLDRLGVGIDALAREGLDLVVTEMSMRYHASARFLDRLDLEISVLHVGAASFRLSGTVLRALPEPDSATGSVSGSRSEREPRAGSGAGSGAGREEEPTRLSTGVLVFCVVGRTTGAVRALPEQLRKSLKECRHDADI
ncbi:acyl-CoA thioesterase [Streptosporangium sp. NPDC002524]|uniref:acyl-CoA thioesterase n=1 Tax=Streptosporangium sp. NPDC002524 TaxID=3154537 RepID=UPI00332314AE